MVIKKYKVGISEMASESTAVQVKNQRLLRYEVVQAGFALLPVVFGAMSYVNYVFAAAPTDYRCLLPECETLTNASVALPAWWPGHVDSRCSRPILRTPGACASHTFTNHTEACDAWVYADANSVVAEFDLACKEWHRTLIGTVHNVGILVSMPILGFISDRWGRRVAILVSSLGIIVGSLKALVMGPSAYYLYLAVEFAEAMIVGGVYTTSFVLVLEVVGKSKSPICILFFSIAIMTGDLSLAFVYWVQPYWRHMHLMVYCPALIFLSYFFLLDESLRWLVTNGKSEKAVTLIQKIERWNNKKVKDTEVVKEEESKPTEIFSIGLLFSSPVLLRRVLVCCWWWFSAALVYYGLIINSVVIPGNKLAHFAMTTVAGFPGDLIALLALERVGRKVTLLAGFVVCGVCCVATGLVSNDHPSVAIALFLLGKASINMCFDTIYVYTAELMPTSARGALVGACSMAGRVGSVLSPLTPLLIAIWPGLPTVTFGACALAAAALTLAAPETRLRPLPDTVAEAADL